MRFALGMDNREIARALGRSEGATKVLIHRAIKQLEHELGSGGGGRMSAEQAAAGQPDDGPGLRDHAAAGGGARAGRAAGQLVDELESRLAERQAAAIEALEELSDWELDAMRDPRNWVRPVAALAVGTAAGHGAGRARSCAASRRRRPRACAGIAEQGGTTLRGAVSSARSLIR